MKQRLAAAGKGQHNGEKQKKCAKAGAASLLAAAREKGERDDEKKHVCALGPRWKGVDKQKLDAEAEQKKAGKNIMIFACGIRLSEQGGAANGKQSRPPLEEAE